MHISITSEDLKHRVDTLEAESDRTIPKSVFDVTDGSHMLTPDDYVKNASLPYELDDNYHICVVGASRAGKSNLVNRLLMHHYLHTISPDCVYIFSPSFKTDKSYQPVRNYLRHELKEKYDAHVKLAPDEETLLGIVSQQRKALKANDDVRYREVYGVSPPISTTASGVTANVSTWGTDPWADIHDVQKVELPIKKYLVIIDDCLGDTSMKSYNSWLAMFSTWSRHSNIVTIWLGQVYKRLPSTVRQMADLIIMLYMYPIAEDTFKELFNTSRLKLFNKFYEDFIQKGPQYSFIVIDKNASHDTTHNIMFEAGSDDPQLGLKKNDRLYVV